MGHISHVLGRQEERLAASNTPEHKTSMDQTDFMTILVAQLTHQDPLNPMDDKDMTGQLAEFASLEQLTNINTSIKSLTDRPQDDMVAAVSFIGKDIKAEGYKIAVNEGKISTIYYGMSEPVTSIRMNIYDEEGAIIRSIVLGSKQAGTYQYEWDGKNESGEIMPDGIYGIGLLGEDKNGKPVMLQTEIAGTVDGVVNENGEQFLRLEDGRYLNMLNVKEIVEAGADPIVDPDDPDKPDDPDNNNDPDNPDGDGEAEA